MEPRANDQTRRQSEEVGFSTYLGETRTSVSGKSNIQLKLP